MYKRGKENRINENEDDYWRQNGHVNDTEVGFVYSNKKIKVGLSPIWPILLGKKMYKAYCALNWRQL